MKKCIVASCLVINDGKLLMLEHRKIGKWLPPGGHVEPEEFPDEAALRETREETGLDVEIIGDDSIMHTDQMAHTLREPFAIVYEDVPYKIGPMHTHFDMVYVVKVRGGRLGGNSESTGIRWMESKEIEKLDTLPNVKAVALAALRRYGKSKLGS